LRKSFDHLVDEVSSSSDVNQAIEALVRAEWSWRLGLTAAGMSEANVAQACQKGEAHELLLRGDEGQIKRARDAIWALMEADAARAEGWPAPITIPADIEPDPWSDAENLIRVHVVASSR
jgi:hypothetical protein